MLHSESERWRKMYAAACDEKASELRWAMLMEAQGAILERAMVLQQSGVNNNAECRELESAAEVIARMKGEYAT